MNPAEASEWMDFTTHPCWDRLTNTISEMLSRETSTLASFCTEEVEHKVRVQAGVVDGIKRVLMYLERQAVHARSKPHG